MSKDIEKAAPSEPDKLLELIGQLPAESREILKEALDRNEDKSAHLTTVSAYFSGPLPPPSLLEAYQKIDGKFPNGIMAMAKKEQSHRHAMEDRALQSNISLEKCGQSYIFWIYGLFIFAGSFMAYIGHVATGTIILAAQLAGLAAQLISDHRRKRIKDEKQETG